jgi:S-adenosylmethionine synthetase
VECFGTNRIDESRIALLISDHFDLRPGAIIQKLNLRRPIYRQTAVYGHFGRPELDLPWERLDMAATLRAAAGIKLDEEKFPLPVLK